MSSVLLIRQAMPSIMSFLSCAIMRDSSITDVLQYFGCFDVVDLVYKCSCI